MTAATTVTSTTTSATGSRVLRLGARTSPLARAQVDLVAGLLAGSVWVQAYRPGWVYAGAALWLAEVFEPIVRAVPRELGGKLEPAEVVHEVLEHRWYMSEREDRNVPMAEAVQSYLDDELRHRRDEAEIMLTADSRSIGLDEDSEYEDN